MKCQLCDPTEWTIERVLDRYPRIVAHLICESLGYFTPRGAANAIAHYKNRRAFRCEWYDWIGRQKYGRWPTEKELIEIGADILRRAIKTRHYHTGYMNSYARAKAEVEAELEGHGPIFASWF